MHHKICYNISVKCQTCGQNACVNHEVVGTYSRTDHLAVSETSLITKRLIGFFGTIVAKG